MQRVRFPLGEQRSYLVTYQDNDTCDKFGMYVWADDHLHAKKLVSLKTRNATVLDAELKMAKNERFI